MHRIPIMIVDDDHILLEDIIQQYNWEENGFELIGTAVNGVQALALFRERRPKVIITDIVMPVMNGIELLREIKKADSAASVILLTSHDDFNYAKQGLKYGANDYILKNEIDTEILSEKLELIKNELLNESKFNTFLKQKIINDLFRLKYQSILTTPASDKNIDEFIHVNRYYYILTEVNTPFYAKNPDTYISEDILDAISAFESGGILPDVTAGISQRHILSLINAHDIKSESAVTDSIYKYLSRLAERLKKEHKFSASFLFLATPKSVIDFYDIFTHYELEQRYFGRFSSGCGIINIASLAGKPKPQPVPADMKKLKDAVSANDTEAVKNIFSELRAEVKRSAGYDIYSDIVTTVYSVIDDMYYSDSFEHISFPEVCTYEEFFDWAAASYEKYLSSGAYGGKEGVSLPTKKTMEYISLHYREPDLSIQTIANSVYLSAGYLCTLFKNETGKSINEYVTDIRIRKAQAFLREPSYKVYEIASLVGYSSSQYFSQIFQKVTGMTPKEYKKRAGHE